MANVMFAVCHWGAGWIIFCSCCWYHNPVVEKKLYIMVTDPAVPPLHFLAWCQNTLPTDGAAKSTHVNYFIVLFECHVKFRAFWSCFDAQAHQCFLTGIQQLSCQNDHCHHHKVWIVENFAHYQLLENKIYYMVRKLKEEALDRTLWTTRFGRGCGPVVRKTTEWMNEWMNEWMRVLHEQMEFVMQITVTTR